MSSSEFTEQSRRVADHWSRLAVSCEGALKSLEAKGIAANAITAEDLHAIDMLHMGGLAATDELATLAGIAKGHRVLDVGSGVGGPAGRLASKYGATICGLELSKSLYETCPSPLELCHELVSSWCGFGRSGDGAEAVFG